MPSPSTSCYTILLLYSHFSSSPSTPPHHRQLAIGGPRPAGPDIVSIDGPAHSHFSIGHADGCRPTAPLLPYPPAPLPSAARRSLFSRPSHQLVCRSGHGSSSSLPSPSSNSPPIRTDQQLRRRISVIDPPPHVLSDSPPTAITTLPPTTIPTSSLLLTSLYHPNHLLPLTHHTSTTPHPSYSPPPPPPPPPPPFPRPRPGLL